MKFVSLLIFEFSLSVQIFESEETIECYACAVEIDAKTGQAIPGFGDISCKNNISALAENAFSYPKYFVYEIEDGTLITGINKCMTVSTQYIEEISSPTEKEEILVEYFERGQYSVFEGSRLLDVKNIFVDQYIYGCGTNCSTCSMEFQEEYEVIPIFTDEMNPCVPYCQYNQVRFNGSEEFTTVDGSLDCLGAVNPNQGSCTDHGPRKGLVDFDSDQSDLCEVGRLSLSADGKEYDQVFYTIACVLRSTNFLQKNF